MSNLDKSIENKYLKKSGFGIGYNFFYAIVFMAVGTLIPFFMSEHGTVVMLSVPGLALYAYILLQRKKPVVSSVGIYKYSDIFMEILKSVATKKKYLKDVKKLWKQFR